MIGKRIRELRLEKKITQRELADYLGVTPKMVSFYENEERAPQQAAISKIAKYFNVSTDYLLGTTGIRNVSDSEIAQNKLKRLNEEFKNYSSQKELIEHDRDTLLEGIKEYEAKLSVTRIRLYELNAGLESVEKKKEEIKKDIYEAEKEVERLSELEEEKTEIIERIEMPVFDELYSAIEAIKNEKNYATIQAVMLDLLTAGIEELSKENKYSKEDIRRIMHDIDEKNKDAKHIFIVEMYNDNDNRRDG